MIETDYVWLKPLVALPAEAPASRAQGFPFGYIAPQVACFSCLVSQTVCIGAPL